MRTGGALALALLLAGGCGQPQDNPDGTTKIYSACMDRAQGVTVDVHNCMAEEYGRQDDRLNQAYREAMKRLAPARRQALRREERAWLAATDKACNAAVGDEEGGSIVPLIIDGCWISAQVKRIRELRSWR